MSKRTRKAKGVSLLQHFDPPAGYVGCFGWLCGYSADADFLDMAAERFTGFARGQRAHAGRIALAVMLDPGNPRIAPIDAPSVAHLLILPDKQKPFELLHAKVALLGFRDPEDPARWIVRLLVSTGNWTRQTLEESLDLVWRVDVTGEEIESAQAQTQQACSDIDAAIDLFAYLMTYFDLRLLDASANDHLGDTAQARGQLNGWLDDIVECKRGKPRFFDNRKESLLTQLPRLIERAGISAACNYLAMGSGFYESAGAANQIPKVLGKIVGTLKKARLTASCKIDVFVNPLGCQAVAKSVTAMAAAGFAVRPARPSADLFPDGRDRTLHAKFLFGANWRKGSNNCASAWVYLGSGNLTGPGFDAKAAPGRGNLEAGVVFAPEALVWYPEDENQQEIPPARVITNLLPMQWEQSYNGAANLIAGGDMAVRPDACVAPPVAWMEWVAAEKPTETESGNTPQLQSRLCLPERLPATFAFEVIDATHHPCVTVDSGFVWQGDQPRQVNVRWTGENGARHECLLPVLDEFGRVAATGMSSLDLDEVAWQLAQFPSTPDDEGADCEGTPHDPATGDQPTQPRAAPLRSDYAIRQMMELVENVAARQTAVAKNDWFAWCNRFEQTLSRASDSAGVQSFIMLKINPLSPLHAVPFRPVFAETDDSDEGKRYLAALQRIEARWAVGGLNAIGETR